MLSNLRSQVETLYSQKIKEEQFTPWGEIYWLQLDSSGGQAQSRLSIAMIYPGHEHKIHTHPGYEEILIGLEGESQHFVDNQWVILEKGKIGHVRGNGQHGMKNTTDQPARFMSIVTPVMPFPFDELSWTDDIELEQLIDSIDLSPIVQRFSRSAGLPVALTNMLGNRLTEQSNLPGFCKLCYSLRAGDCYLFSEDSLMTYAQNYNEAAIQVCRYGVFFLKTSIVFNGRLLGHLGCGHSLLNMATLHMPETIGERFSSEYYDKACELFDELPIISRNQLSAAADIISLVNASLLQLIIFSAREKQMNAYRLKISHDQMRQAELENMLNEVKLKFLESQVNPHFLFNALNTIAQTAVMEGATTVAQLTYALSNLLRCSLGKGESLITVKEELGYINDYLYIQKTRFPKRFVAEIEIAEQVMEVQVPFMMLMVLVENAIIHGFANIRGGGRLLIKGSLEGSFAVFEINDNGAGVSDEIIRQVSLFGVESTHAPNPKGIGLRNIFNRLQHFFGGDFTFQIQRNQDKGTRVTIRLPLSSRVLS